MTTTFQTVSVQMKAGISPSRADQPADAQRVTPEIVDVMQVVSAACLCVFPCVSHIQKQKETENNQNELIS